MIKNGVNNITRNVFEMVPFDNRSIVVFKKDCPGKINRRENDSSCKSRISLFTTASSNEHGGVSTHQPHDFCSTIYSGADQRKLQNSASLAFVRGIHQSALNSQHNGPITRKMFPLDDVIILPTAKDTG